MNIAMLPANEQQRLNALHEYFILDTLPEAEYDDITRLASEVCNAPIAYISFIDMHRQWFKSRLGFSETEISRDYSICSHTINHPEDIFIVTDLGKDERFFDNSLIEDKYLRFYAGVPLVNPDGFALGTLCVLDRAPKDLNEEQIKDLKSLAGQVINLMELRKKNLQLNELQAELKGIYADLEKFTHMASHDLKSPLNNIISLASLLKEEYSAKLDGDGMEYIDYVNQAASHMSDLIGGILTYAKSSQIQVKEREVVNLPSLIKEVIKPLALPPHAVIVYDEADKFIFSSRTALAEIFNHLIRNAVTYNDKSEARVQIVCNEDKFFYTLKVKDNGTGIAEEDKEKIFTLFKRLSNENDHAHAGIGLAIVKRLVTKMGGTIKVSSELLLGTSFTIRLPK